MATKIEGCIVHERKHLTKFHTAVNQIHRTNEFDVATLRKLPKLCCSCDNRTGASSYSIDNLRDICRLIQSSESSTVPKTKPVEYIYCCELKYPPSYNLLQRARKSGRFVGKNGSNLKQLEKKLEVIIHIVNLKSTRKLREKLAEFQENNSNDHSNFFWLLFKIKNDKNDKKQVNEIKRELIAEWNKVNVPQVKLRKTFMPQSIFLSQTNILGDTRYQSKLIKPKDKKKKKQPIREMHVPPQPTYPPIRMPQHLPSAATYVRKN